MDNKAASRLVSKSVNEEIIAPLDMENGPLWRARLFKLKPNYHVLVITVHHVIFDGMSKVVLLQELGQHYTSFQRNRCAAELDELEIQFPDYAIWQQQLVASKVYEKQLDYWRSELAELEYPVMLPNHASRPEAKSQAQSVYFNFSARLSDKVYKTAAQTSSSPFVVLVSAFSLLLNRYTGQQELVICAPMASRNRRELEKLIGYFNNVLPLRIELATGQASDTS